MTFSKGGHAIIGNLIVPPAEVTVLRALAGLKAPATVAKISSVLERPMSDATVYVLLYRLKDKRKLVTCETVQVPVLDTSVSRVLWTPSKESIEFFDQADKLST
jgi:hypothetical protein